MKTMGMVINLEGLKLGAEDKEKLSQEIVKDVIKNIMLGWGQQQQKGMQEEDRRKYYKISDALEAVVKTNVESVELEDDWFGFIKKCKKEMGLIPNDLVRRIEELIDAVVNR